MNKETSTLLEQHFETAFAAPDGITKLRELILTLAMQGRLVEQDPNDPPASELLKEIEAEKQRLIKEKKIKKPKLLPLIKHEEEPYALPQEWEWVRLGELIELISGQHLTPDKYNKNGIGHPYYTGPADFGATNPDASRWTIIDRSMAIQEDILLTVKGAGVGKMNILSDKKAAISRQLMALRVVRVNRDYILRFLDTIFYELQALAVGIAIPGISRNDVLLRKVPLPPFPEQHRIVARIDQLMARCDELEKLRKEQEKKRLAVHAAAIRGLLDASDDSAWDFIGQHFSELYTVKENVAELRKAILQLAVMGRLVPQNPNDPPAGELLKEIKAEKQRLIKEKKIKKTKPLPPIKPEEAPYELPQGWEWIRFESLVLKSMTGVDRGKKFQSKSNSHPYFKMNNISNDGKCDFTKVTKIDFSETENDFNKYILNDGDFLFNTRNSKELVGKTCIFKNPNNERWYFNNNILRIIFHPEFIQQYANIWFLSPFGKTELDKLKSATTNVAAIYQGKLAVYPIPFPPLPEQHRIVARIDQLMAFCDNLDQQIDAATNKQSELLNAVMAQI